MICPANGWDQPVIDQNAQACYDRGYEDGNRGALVALLFGVFVGFGMGLAAAFVWGMF